MRLVILLCLSLFLTACGPTGCDRKDTIPTPAPPSDVLPPIDTPKPGKDGKVDPLEQAKYDARKYAELAAQAEARYEVLSKQRQEENLRTQVAWITGIGLIVAAIAGVAAFIVPIGKKTLVGISIGCVVIVACAQAFSWAVPYLPWIGGAFIVGGGIWAAINWRKLGDAVKVAADHGDRIESWLEDLPTAMRNEAQKIVSDAKVETQQQAERLGVQAPLQFLRGKVPSLWQRLFS
jgi:hypothetical protein